MRDKFDRLDALYGSGMSRSRISTLVDMHAEQERDGLTDEQKACSHSILLSPIGAHCELCGQLFEDAELHWGTNKP